MSRRVNIEAMVAEELTRSLYRSQPVDRAPVSLGDVVGMADAFRESYDSVFSIQVSTPQPAHDAPSPNPPSGGSNRARTRRPTR